MQYAALGTGRSRARPLLRPISSDEEMTALVPRAAIYDLEPRLLFPGRASQRPALLLWLNTVVAQRTLIRLTILGVPQATEVNEGELVCHGSRQCCP